MTSPLDPRAMLRVVDELLWVLRREGFDVSTAQAIDVARAVSAVGIEERGPLRDAVAAVILQRAAERVRFEAVFDGYFGGRRGESWGARRTLDERLTAAGFDAEERAALEALLEGLEAGLGARARTLRALLERGAELDRRLSADAVVRGLDAESGPLLGFLAQRLIAGLGTGDARTAMAVLRTRLSERLGARGSALADALAEELREAQQEVAAWLRRRHGDLLADVERARAAHRAEATPFVALSDAEMAEVRRAVRRLAERLRGGARVRERRRTHGGRLDAPRTLRRALRTGGVPFEMVRRARPRDRPKLFLLCDVSESVRAAAAFLLELTYAMQELFARTRSFVFVSELGEVTSLFARETVGVAIARAWGGGVVRAGENSNYGRALRAFEAACSGDLDRRTTVVILGDGRTNYHDAAAEVLDHLRRRCRAVVWLCPEPRGTWGQGDSAMRAYAARSSAVFEVRCAADLERAARFLARGASAPVR